ncbi:MAG TPA: hypothetical protein VFP97_13735 [Chitinophagaceae bacterium]|nr:hypothetical protein [Chitinophagaceae bacterium]
MLGELSDVEIEIVLASQAIGRLTCIDGNYPYVVPVTYAFDGKIHL